MNLINVSKEVVTVAGEYPTPFEASNESIKLFDLSINRCMLPSFIAKFQHLENVTLLLPLVNEMEIWKDIFDFEGFYQGSDYGRIRSLDRLVKNPRGSGLRTVKGRILKPNFNTSGRFQVGLWKLGTRSCSLVHRLVLETFVGPCPEGMECCHNDGNPANNRLENLRWDTPKNNHLDMRRHSTHRGKPIRRSDGIEFINMQIAAEESGCHRGNISAVCRGVGKSTGGFGWKFI